MFRKYRPIIFQILIALAVGGLAAFLTRDNFNVYEEVTRPPLAPPAILFPIVWTVLYTLMGISAGLVKITRGRVPFIYCLQLFVNFFWSLIFFNMQSYLFAFIWLVLLWVLIIAMILDFYHANKVAALLQIPYLLWVTFAGYLNFFIWLSAGY